MPDVFSKAKRSEVMSKIRSSGNRDTECALASVFRAEGITGWRRNRPVFGRPDFVFPQSRTAVFVDGCFWHGCPIHGRLPANNAEFWKLKLNANRSRDKLVGRTLRAAGWRVLRIWEHELRPKNRGTLLVKLRPLLPSQTSPSRGSKFDADT